MIKPDFVHLHQHSSASLLDGLSKIEEIIERTKELGHTSVALTNHGNLFDSWEFYKKAKEAGLNPIVGLEAYICNDIKDKTRKQNHITLLAKNAEGVANLNRLTSLANAEGFYFYPRIDPNMLFANKNGIIVLSGCLGGLISQAILAGDMERAYALAKLFRENMKDDFFIEIQDSGLEEQKIVKPALRQIAKELSIMAVASNDAHYVRAEDALTQEIILTVGQRRKLSDPVRGYDDFDDETKGNTRWKFTSIDYYLKTRDEMKIIYTDEEMDNTLKVAEKCKIELANKKSHIPEFKTPDGSTPYDYLVKTLYKVWAEFGISNYNDVARYQERIRKELQDIKDGNLASYFLIVWDVCRFADSKGIRRGDGRGSAVGSLVSYLLRIHKCDPVKYKLIWERFYNSARKGSLPDIDLDFETDRREEVIAYLKSCYGERRVFQFITYGTYRLKNSIKDVGRVMGYSLEECQEMSDEVPYKYESFDDALAKSEKLRKYAEKYPELFKHIRKLEDVKRDKSSHASAYLICDEDVFDSGCIPLSYDAKNKKMITGLDLYSLEDLGYLKLDLLGLKTLSVLKSIEEQVNGTAKN